MKRALQPAGAAHGRDLLQSAGTGDRGHGPLLRGCAQMEGN
ncbi:hypothetical protein [Acidithiobacillus sp.]